MYWDIHKHGTERGSASGHPLRAVSNRREIDSAPPNGEQPAFHWLDEAVERIRADQRACLSLAVGASLAAFGLSSGESSAEVPPMDPKLYSCEPVTAANEVDPPPPLWELTGDRAPDAAEVAEQRLSERPCAEGNVAVPAAVQAPKGDPIGHRAFLKSRRSSARTEPEGDRPPPPGYQVDYENYYYAGNIWFSTSIGGSVETAIAQPAAGSGEHTIAQLNFGKDGDYYTVELGWQVWQGYGDNRPHLFTYVNKDGYASHGEPGGSCYNCNFVPAANAPYKPGQALNATHYYDSVQIAAMYYEGNWWFWFDTAWIGYTPGSFWGDNFKQSDHHSFYGEVYDQTGPTADMGNGHRGSHGEATVMRQPTRYTSPTTGQAETLPTPGPNAVSDPLLYSIGNIAVNRDKWKFGGPGAG